MHCAFHETRQRSARTSEIEVRGVRGSIEPWPLGDDGAVSRRTTLRIATCGVLLTGLLGAFTVPSQADCAAPELHLPRVVKAGETITVKGEGWAAECNDTRTRGCTGCKGGEPSPPSTGLNITIAPVPNKSLTLMLHATDIAANQEFRLNHDVTIPATLQPGRYRIVVGEGDDEYDSQSELIEVR